MLRIIQQSSSAACKSYYSVSDYYTEDREESVGHWGGKGAALLRLEGKIEKTAFDQLCDNLDPRNGQQLTARNVVDRTVAYDFNFSVPKSVSLLYGLTEDNSIREAFRKAVADTMTDIEAEMQTRVRKNGSDENRTTGNLIYGEFIHSTTRPVDGIPDCQLHSHCVVFNATYDEKEEQWKAGQFRDLKKDAPYFQSAFRVRLANELQELGYEVTRKRDDFEIAGMPRGVLERFSRRKTLIEEKAAQLGIQDAKTKEKLGETTREHKNHTLSWAELQKEWSQRLSADEMDQLMRIYNHLVPNSLQTGGERGAVDHAISHCFTRTAVVDERKLLTEAMKRGLGTVTVEGIQKELSRRPLIQGVEGNRRFVTTAEVLGEERQLVAFARAGRGRYRPLASEEYKIKRTWLNKGQQAAIQHVLSSRDRVILVRGAAGTGKTTLEEELGEAIQDNGHSVVAIAQSAAASRGVLREEAKFAHANTLTKFMGNRELQNKAKGGVIILDESSLIGTQDALALCKLASELDARMVVVGDRRQHRSVVRGQPIELLEKEAKLPVVEVTDILRQKGRYKDATQALSEGKFSTGLATLDALGWILEVPDASRNQEIAAKYLEAVHQTKADGSAKTALIVSPTHLEAKSVTAAVRQQMREEGDLGEEKLLTRWHPLHYTDAQKSDPTIYEPGDLIRFHKAAPGYKSGSTIIVAEESKLPCEFAERFEVYRPETIALAEGDRVRFTAGGSTNNGKHRLENGALHTLDHFDAQGNLVLANGWIVDKAFGHLDHGYVVTSHASQGRTVDQVFIAQSSLSFGASNQRQFYVSASRGKEKAIIFTDDKQSLKNAVLKSDDPISATEFARNHPTGFRGRLKKHLSRLRRAAIPAWTKIEHTFELTPNHEHHREADYAR